MRYYNKNIFKSALKHLKQIDLQKTISIIEKIKRQSFGDQEREEINSLKKELSL